MSERRRRAGPVYDDAMKILAEDDLPAVLAVLGVAGPAETERAANLTLALSVIAAHIAPTGTPVLLDAALTLASLVLPGPIIDTAIKEATMPVPIRETPWFRRWYDEGEEAGLRRGIQEGQREGQREGERRAAVRLTTVLLRRRFGDDPRIPAAAERLADLPDEARLDRIAALTDLDDAMG